MKGQDIKYVALKSQAEAKVSSSFYHVTGAAEYSTFSGAYVAAVAVQRLDVCSDRWPPLQKVERLRRSLHFIGAPQQSRHTVFLDGEEAPSFSPQRHFDTPAELLGRAYNRPRTEQLSSAALVSSTAASLPNSKKLDR